MSLHENWDEETKWLMIKTEFEAGKLSVEAIGRLYGVPGDTIRKRARRANPVWERNLLPTLECEIRARLVAEQEFQPKNDEERVKLLAERQKATIMGHRNDITKVRAAANTILDRLNAWMDGQEFDGPFMGEKESPADLVKKVSDSLRHLIPLERQAMGVIDVPLDTTPKGSTGVALLPAKADDTPEDGDRTTQEAADGGS